MKKKTLSEYARKYPRARPGLTTWHDKVKRAEWHAMTDIQADFPKAKTLNAERARFEIAGGKYRLIAAFHFQAQICWIKFIGSHADYDQIDALMVDQHGRRK